MTSLLRTLLLRSTACSVQSAQCCTRPAWRTLASRLYPPLSQWGMFPAVEAEFEKTEKDHLEAELEDEVGPSHSDVYVKDKIVSTNQFELGGMLWKSVGPGLFHLLPLAVRALQRLEQEIDTEMEALGAQKISLSLLSPAAPWQASGRWSEFGDELFRLQDRKRAKLCLSPTHEEAVTTLVASRGHLSPSQLPIRLYQVTTKFRDEQRPRAGPLRAREFMMKDLYTFDVSSNSAAESYAAILASYTRIFHRLDLPVVVAEAAVGAMGGEVSHEFLLPSSLGEDELLSCEECGRAANMEAVQSPQNGMDMCSKCGGPMRTKRAVELGHAFRLGERYSAALGALSTKPGHSPSPLHMCCFGLGLTRILAAAVETLSENGSLVWPRVIAPFQVVVVGPKAGSREEAALGQGRAEIGRASKEDASNHEYLRIKMIISLWDQYTKECLNFLE
uniref:proline--tRNA ligase n=1 Tax=Eptatretus burgeri TaxID=7764 RepID=A0A8C4QV02_EPTBU